MKKNKFYLLVILSVCGFTSLNAQKINTKSGNMDFLKSEKEFNVEFVYDGVTIGKKNIAEADFIKEKVDDNNAKVAGQGDKWLEDWTSAKTTKFPEKFLTLLRDEGPKGVTVHHPEAKAKYTCIVRAINMEPGFKIGMSTIPAKVDFEISWVDSSDKSKVLCLQSIENSPGSQAMGFDFTSSSRLAESYAKAGKIVGKYLSSNVY